MVARLIVFNATVLVGLWLAWLYGLVDKVVETDTFWLSRAIAAYGVFSLLSFFVSCRSIMRGMRVVVERMNLDEGSLLIDSEIHFVRKHISNLVALGLLGTVIVFTYSLSGVDIEAFGNVEAAAKTIGYLIEGAFVALFTTIVGMVFALWVTVNLTIVERRVKKMIEEVVL